MGEDGNVCLEVNNVYASMYMYMVTALALPTAIWLMGYIIPQLYMSIRPVPDLKKRYSATWALVTGGGTGIGRSLCYKLASQGLNVVVVSLDDHSLTETLEHLRKSYPNLLFRSVGCTFSPGEPYMENIIEKTKDIRIQLIFNNAGFLVTGFLDQAPLPKLQANIECNATAAVNITHHFCKQLVSNQLPGCIVFTSSVAAYIPSPFAAMYASTKAFISQFACCLNIEVKALGIDVCAVHPSPVSSNFYDKVDHKIELMESAQKSAVSPDLLPDEIFRSVGVCVLRDIGGMAQATRIGTFFIPYNIFTMIFAAAAPYLPDYKNHNKNRT